MTKALHYFATNVTMFCPHHLSPGKSLYRGKGIVPYVQLSTNYGLGWFWFKNNIFQWSNSQFYSWLTTAHVVPSPSPCIEISLLITILILPNLDNSKMKITVFEHNIPELTFQYLFVTSDEFCITQLGFQNTLFYIDAFSDLFAPKPIVPLAINIFWYRILLTNTNNFQTRIILGHLTFFEMFVASLNGLYCSLHILHVYQWQPASFIFLPKRT